jgi:heme exporter protein D
MDLGPHAAFIVTAYAAAVSIVLVLIAWVWLDYRAQKQNLDDLETRGVTRRSARASRQTT